MLELNNMVNINTVVFCMIMTRSPNAQVG